MKILVICNKSPWPKHEGGPIAMHAMISGLLEAGHSVKVLAANTNKFNVDPATIPADFAEKTRIEFVDINLSLNVFSALWNFVTARSYHVTRFHTRIFAEKLTQILQAETFDIIHIEMLYMASYLDIIRKYSNAKVVLRAHNIEHKIWQRIAEGCSNPFKRLYLTQLYRSLRRFEVNILDRVDGIVAITPVDARNFARICSNNNIISIPFGINLSTLDPAPSQPDNATLFHIGAMNWFPNQEGIKWLLNNVWPKVLRTLPGIQLHLAGRYMPEWMQKLSLPNVTVDGEVPDVWEYMKRYSIMVVPLFSGSGIRIKIVEGMAAGKAIITTAIGAEGINFVNGRDLLIAKDANSFADAIRQLYADESLRTKLGENARKLIANDHDNTILMQKLSEFYLVVVDQVSKGA